MITTKERAKERAKELFDKFYKVIPSDEMGDNYGAAKQCALIAINELLKLAIWTDDKLYDYFMEVRLELEKL
jgi:hypothetical protein